MIHESAEITNDRDRLHRAMDDAGRGQRQLDDIDAQIRDADERGVPWRERAHLYADEARLLSRQYERVDIVARFALRQAIIEADGSTDRAAWAEEMLASAASMQDLLEAVTDGLAQIRGLVAAGELRQAADAFGVLPIVTGKLDQQVRFIDAECWPNMPRV